MQHTPPPDAVEIESVPGIFAHAEARPHQPNRWEFSVHSVKGRQTVCWVNMPLTQTYRSRDQRPDEAMIQPNLPRLMNEYSARARAEVLLLAADFAAAMNEAYGPELSKQQQQFDEWNREQKLAYQRDEEQFIKLYSQVIWMVGTKFRLKRRGMKATVFGEILRIDEPTNRTVEGEKPYHRDPYMQTVSEKGVPMRIRVRDIIWMEVKEDSSSRRYTNIYTEEVKS